MKNRSTECFWNSVEAAIPPPNNNRMKDMQIFSGTPITLEELLDRREARAARQQALRSKYASLVVCLCANMPGPVKQNEAARRIVAIGERLLQSGLAEKKYAVLHVEAVQAATGPERLYCVAAPANALKALCIALEEKSPAGRLLDLDVIGPEGPISRVTLGHPPRRCLVCGEIAAVCTGRAPHPLEQVQLAIAEMLEDSNGD